MRKATVSFIRKDGDQLAMYDKLKYPPSVGDNVRFKTADGFDFFLVTGRQFDFQHNHLTLICDSVADQSQREDSTMKSVYITSPRDEDRKRLEALLKAVEVIRDCPGIGNAIRRQVRELIEHVRKDAGIESS